MLFCIQEKYCGNTAAISRLHAKFQADTGTRFILAKAIESSNFFVTEMRVFFLILCYDNAKQA